MTIAGNLVYGRPDWIGQVVPQDAVNQAERILAWGRWMILDTTYAVKPHGVPPRLAELRSALIGGYPNVGPIFA